MLNKLSSLEKHLILTWIILVPSLYLVDAGSSLLLIVFGLAVFRAVLNKHASYVIDHYFVPMIMALWILVGILLLSPFYGHLFIEDIQRLDPTSFSMVWVAFFLIPVIKSVVMTTLGILLQMLVKKSFSSTSVVRLIQVVFIALGNAALGEVLPVEQWIVIILMALLGVAFYLKGHLHTLDRKTKGIWMFLCVFGSSLSILDYFALQYINWYTYLLMHNICVVIFFFIWRPPYKHFQMWKDTLRHPFALGLGASFLIYEFLKFYQMDTYDTVTLTAAVEAATIPIIMLFSAHKWQEGSVAGQLMWGVFISGLMIIFFTAF